MNTARPITLRRRTADEATLECIARAIDPTAWSRAGKYRQGRRNQSMIAAARALSALAGLGFTLPTSKENLK